ncbi:hypothetical protein TeGR_g11538 [Tetraparma gracilis]|uniref:Cilia- and flagella-associated protein 91 n=1 Tax=Tetraparma gracilis TaxID=2962635 RepID=A0ABQ6MWH0_9STRA|nr:hypothetical protein TeGR_g11538 [Tetraparma gracilis]
MAYTRTVEQRAYDHLYDPLYTTPTTGLYRTSNPPVRAAAAPGNDVSGTGRHRYFKQPVVPHLHAVKPEVLLAATSGADPLQASVVVDDRPTKSAAVQTQYRESEAQTNPYTPQYVVPAGAPDPEVLLLDGLTNEDGLKLGNREVSMIEMSRQKRLLTLSLPPITDEASLELRKRLMEAQEVSEFEAREREFDSMRDKRVAVLRAAIDERDAANEFLAEQRVEAVRQRRMEGRDKAVAAVQTRRVKALRKLAKERKKALRATPGGVGVAAGRAARDIIGEYADAASCVYAPVRRDGQALDKGGSRYDVAGRTAPLENLDALKGMEATIPRGHREARLVKPSKAKTVKNAADRKELALTSDLQLMDTIIRDAAESAREGGEGDTPPSDTPPSDTPPSSNAAAPPGGSPSWKAKSASRRLERPATPRAPPQDEAAAALDRALLLVQRLLRGRAVQNTMYEGKERRTALIEELREEAAAEAAEDDATAKAARRAEVHGAAVETIAGETSSALLDFFAKDLVRKEEKERIAAMAAAADAERARREVAEGGRRQAEELARGREDEAYRQIMRVHHAAARSYVEDLIGGALEKVVQDMVAQIARGGAAEAVGGRAAEEGGRELVGSFLEPAAAVVAERAREGEEEGRFVAAAQDTLGGAVEDVTKHSTS